MGPLVKKTKQLHLKLPTAMLQTTLRPTGCRSSPEAQGSWLLGAVACAIRELRPKGVLPIFKDIDDYRDDLHASEIHISLLEEDFQLFTDVSKEEAGSRGEFVRKSLITGHRIDDEYLGVLNHDGLVAELITRFSPSSPVIAGEW